MKPLDHSSIRPHALAGVIAGAVVLAVALCRIFFPQLLSFAMPWMQAGTVVCIAAGWLSAARKKVMQQQNPRLVPINARRRG